MTMYFLQVSGDANEQQFLTSIRTYSLRDQFMDHILDHLFDFANDGHLNTLQEELVIVCGLLLTY